MSDVLSMINAVTICWKTDAFAYDLNALCLWIGHPSMSHTFWISVKTQNSVKNQKIVHAKFRQVGKDDQYFIWITYENRKVFQIESLGLSVLVRELSIFNCCDIDWCLSGSRFGYHSFNQEALIILEYQQQFFGQIFLTRAYR